MLALLVPALMFASGGGGDRLTAPPRPIKIVGGDAVERPDPFSGVIAIAIGQTNAGSLCTGTLIRPGLILTAAHCLRSVRNVDEIRLANAVDLFESSAQFVGATGFGMHPDFDIESKEDAFDFGYITFDGGLDAEPIAPIVDQDEWDALEPTFRSIGGVILVGYGIDPQTTARFDGLGVKRFVETELHRYTPSGIEFIAGGDGRDSCQGDSGGPALARTNDGELRLIGITARGSDPCGQGGFYGIPYYALEWLSGEPELVEGGAVGELCGEACESCDCLQTTPPTEEGCGSCQVKPARGHALWMALAGFLGLAATSRRRRAPAKS